MAIIKKVTMQVVLTGVTGILFDRYAGNNQTQLAPEQKLYLDPENAVCLPALNVLSFYTAQNTESAPKLLLDPRKYRAVCSALLGSITIQPDLIPFTRDGKVIRFGASFIDDRDVRSGITILRHVARLAHGIPNPKERPFLSPPWSLAFKMTVLPHPDLSLEMIENLSIDGGLRLGLGTYRKAFGKFAFAWQKA